MTYKEAKRYILENWFDGDQDVKAVVDGDEETMTMKMTVETLEKQIPTKPMRKGRTIFCPNCNECLDLPEILNYCYCCGQAIDWSEEK